MLISFHSYKGGTGKTNFLSNLGICLARKGAKICIIDFDINGPGVHSLFNLQFENSLIEFLNNNCQLEDIIHQSGIEEKLYLIPARVHEEDVTSFFSTPSEAKENILQLIDSLQKEHGFEYILFDCGPGINKSSFLLMNIVDKAIIISTIDRQDIRGTYILTNMAKRLGASPFLLFNRAPPDRPDDMDKVITKFSKKLDTGLLGIIPYDKEVADTWSRRLVADSAPNSSYYNKVQEIASILIPG